MFYCCSILEILDKYVLVKNKKTCNAKATYTGTGDGCNGWSGISLEQCKIHCDNNDTPNNCQQKVCEFVIYFHNNNVNRAWCHLADSTCVAEVDNKNSDVYKKIHKGIISCFYRLIRFS